MNKIEIKCKVESCSKCENCEINWPITFVDKTNARKTLVGFKCTRYGHCAETREQLHKEGYMDDLIFIGW